MTECDTMGDISENDVYPAQKSQIIKDDKSMIEPIKYLIQKECEL
jgi:hypothetical protein